MAPVAVYQDCKEEELHVSIFGGSRGRMEKLLDAGKPISLVQRKGSALHSQ